MSKGSKRRSAKYQARIYKAITDEHRASKPAPIKDTAYLTMTDAEIDTAYWMVGKADRTRMKKDAAKERQRKAVKAILEQERQS